MADAKPLGAVRIDFIADIASFIKNVKVADTAVGRLGKDMQNAAANMGKAFKGVASAIFSLPTAIAAVGAAIGGAKLASSFDAAAQSADKLNKASKRIGVSVETLSALSFAAGDSGLEFETLTKLISRADKNLAQSAFGGRGPADEAIAKLGLRLFDANGELRTFDRMLPEIAVGLKKVSSAGERTRLAEQIFGKQGGEAFIQWLEDSGDLVQVLGQKVEQAHKLGVVFTSDQADRMSAYRDAIEHVGAAWLGLRVKVMDQVAPFLAKTAEDLALWVARVGTVAGNLTKKIVQAFGDGPEGQEAREQIKQFGIDVAHLLGTVFESGAELAVAAIYDAFAAGWRIIGEDMVNWAKRTAFRVSAVFNPVMASQLLAAADAMAVGDREFSQRLDEAKRYWATPKAWDRAVANVSDDVDRLGETLTKMDLARPFEDAAKAAKDFAKALDRAGEQAKKQDGPFKLFIDGAIQGFNELRDQASDFGRLGQDIMTTLGRSISSGLADAIVDAGTSFKDFGKAATDVLNNVLKRIASMALEFAILRGIVGIGGAIGGAFGASAQPAPGTVGPPVPSAMGNVFASGRVVPFADGGLAGMITDRVIFPMRDGKIGMAGEDGDEYAVEPVRLPSGRLGVAAMGGGDVTVQIIDQRSSGSRPSVSQQQGPNGEKLIRVLIRDEVRSGIRGGAYDRVAGEAWGVRRLATPH